MGRPKRLLSQLRRDVLVKKRLKEWFVRQRSSQKKIRKLRNVLMLRMDLNLISTTSRIHLMMTKRRSALVPETRRNWKILLTKLSTGWRTIQRPTLKNTVKSNEVEQIANPIMRNMYAGGAGGDDD